MQTLIYQRAQLRRVIGMDVPGKADALGMGWVYMAPKMADRGLFKNRWRWRIHHLYGDDSAIKRRCFCGGHRSPNTRFVNMSDGVNNLVAELSANKAQVLTASN